MIIKKINSLVKKYKEVSKRGAEYISVGEVLNDLYYLAQEIRIARLPKDQR